MTDRQGELVREWRRQRGLPLPVAGKVLPFRPIPPYAAHPAIEQAPLLDAVAPKDLGTLRTALAEARVEDAWARLAAAEQAGSTR
jgi:hypothetical protein